MIHKREIKMEKMKKETFVNIFVVERFGAQPFAQHARIRRQSFTKSWLFIYSDGIYTKINTKTRQKL